ncbi:HEPN domain-containing protein [Methanopyrus sp. SNP6]|uniref:HEPN domain-containing protein n=1 Tax=Methanopyrus sp. SNP6 TaxID=1937005 RepID=UPI0011E5A922|nr:HEPN domain-containing protein [Methanopyrus sp. SNP6]
MQVDRVPRRVGCAIGYQGNTGVLLFDAYTDARYLVEFPYDTEEDAKRFVEVADLGYSPRSRRSFGGHGFEVRC